MIVSASHYALFYVLRVIVDLSHVQVAAFFNFGAHAAGIECLLLAVHLVTFTLVRYHRILRNIKIVM